MDKNKEKEEFAFALIAATSPLGVKDLTKQFDYKTVVEYLINAGYGNIKRAAKKFTQELIEYAMSYDAISAFSIEKIFKEHFGDFGDFEIFD